MKSFNEYHKNSFFNIIFYLCQANQVQVLVIAEKTAQSAQYYPSLQTFVVLELGFSITPVPGPIEAAGVLAQMVSLVVPYLTMWIIETNINV